MPFPNPDTQFRPGESGNPGGHSRGRRITSALIRLIEEQGLDRQLALTLLAKALGDKKLLKDREPDWTWFSALMELVDGPIKRDGEPAAPPPDDTPRRIVIPDVDDRLPADDASGKPA